MAASLDAYQLFKDDMRVLKQGHSPDPRVRTPTRTMRTESRRNKFKRKSFICSLGAQDCCSAAVRMRGPCWTWFREDHYPELYPDAVAQCIFESVAFTHLPTATGMGKTLARHATQHRELSCRARKAIDDTATWLAGQSSLKQ